MNAGPSGDKPLDMLKEILGLRSQFDVFRHLKRTAELFGYRSFLVQRLPASTSLDLAENSIITNWPAEYLGAFDRLQLLRSSPLNARLRTSVVPFCFRYEDLVTARSGEASATARRLYAEFGFVTGACVPVHSTEGERAAVVLTGDREPLSDPELAELTLVAIHLYQRLMEVSRTDVRLDQPLTERELECLTWTAAGKTSADIAQILDLSEHTVNHYLNRATKKLDTVNRTQAVAKALRRGLIR